MDNKFTGKNVILTFHEGDVASPFDVKRGEPLRTLWVHIALTDEGARALQKMVLSFVSGNERELKLKAGELLVVAELTNDLDKAVISRLGEIINNLSKEQLTALISTLWFEGEEAVAVVRSAAYKGGD